MKSIFKAFRKIKENNGYEAFFLLSSMYLERVSCWRFPFKMIKLFVQRYYLCDISPYSFNSVEAILTCRMPHPFLIIINGTTSIGKNCTIYHQVTIGNRESHHYNQMGGVTLHDNVYIGCGATIIGNVSIGNNVRIGAMSLVLKDVEDNNTVVGTYK